MLVKYRQFIVKYTALQFLSVIISPQQESGVILPIVLATTKPGESVAEVVVMMAPCPINHPFIHLSLFPVSSQHQNLYIIGPILTFYTIVPPRFLKIRCVKS